MKMLNGGEAATILATFLALVVVADAGSELVALDYAGIESRIVA